MPRLDELTPVERSVYRSEVARKRCAACNHGEQWRLNSGAYVFDCRIGRKWPKRGICRGFDDRER